MPNPLYLGVVADAAHNQLTAGLFHLYASGQYTDLTIMCANQEWRVHCVIVCACSAWFAKACKDVFQERASGIVTLRDEDPLMIGQLVNSFYGCDYDSPGDELVEFATEFHAGMYAVGDQYAAEPLKDLARYKISENLKEGSQPLDRWVVRGATETSLASSKLSTLQLCQAIEAYETALSLG